MESINNTDTSLDTAHTDSYLDKWARQLVINQFHQFHQGSIVIRQLGYADCRICTALPDSQPAEIDVLNASFWRDLVTGGSIGAAESYVAGDWESPDLVRLLRFFARNISVMNRFEDRFSAVSKPLLKLFHWLNRNSKEGSRKNIAAHYDLGNEFFSLFLDDTMMYSSAMYSDAQTTLEEAAVHKLDTLCRRLELSPEDRVVEIGSGWGGFAIHAARHYGCHVTTTTISKAQFDLAQQRINEAGLADRITLLLEDYRSLDGQFDKLVSIEMIEAVGPQYLPGYIRQIDQLVRPGGQVLIQAINMPEQRYRRALKNVDFIQRHIFPGSFIPSFGAILSAVESDAELVLANVADLTTDYARTLADWRARFSANEQQIRDLGYDLRFRRLWNFYFSYCEAGFSERAIGVAQIHFLKPRSALHQGI